MINTSEKKLTNRAKQAIATKKLILSEGRKLILKKGFNNVTVAEISKKANITVGTFYHYFSSKEDLIIGLMPQVEDFKKKYKREMLKMDSRDKIIYYFSWFNDEIERSEISPDLICQLFSSQKTLVKLEDERILDGVEYVVEGQVNRKITKDYSPTYISQLLFAAGRGVCLRWALRPDSISLSRATNEIVTRLTKSFEIEPRIDEKE